MCGACAGKLEDQLLGDLNSLLGPMLGGLAGDAVDLEESHLIWPKAQRRVRYLDSWYDVRAVLMNEPTGNGYTLVRKVFLDHAKMSVEQHVPEFGCALGDERLRCSVIALAQGHLRFGRCHTMLSLLAIGFGFVALGMQRVQLHPR